MANAAASALCPGDCASEHPGHTLTFLRFKLATRARHAWRDAIVTNLAPDGTLELCMWDDGSSLRLWHHADLRDSLQVGMPVSCNTQFWLLASGNLRASVRQLEA